MGRFAREDKYCLWFSYWPKPEYRFSLQYEKRRRGEGRMMNFGTMNVEG